MSTLFCRPGVASAVTSAHELLRLSIAKKSIAAPRKICSFDIFVMVALTIQQKICEPINALFVATSPLPT